MTTSANADLGSYVRRAAAAGEVVVQPRMGMSAPEEMAAGLRAVATVPATTAGATTIGTITVDSYTRVGEHEQARAALRAGHRLNGFPLVVHGPQATARVSAAAGDRPVQVRHGSARPQAIFRTLAAAGLSASEGGPVSYCLPYGRTPLAESVASWRDASQELTELCRTQGRRAHLETFGGCLLGQLCPPSLLVAVSLLEGLFFAQQGVPSISLSYAQQTHPVQDVEALAALRQLAGELLPESLDWHLVVYTYMGVYPDTAAGAQLLLDRSAELAVRGGAERLIVKTASEARGLPSVAENVAALRAAARATRNARATRKAGEIPWAHQVDHGEVLTEARVLVEAVLGLSDDVGAALVTAFARGLLDVPFCVHQDNRGATQGTIDGDGRLRWAQVGNLPLPAPAGTTTGAPVTSDGLLRMLRHTADHYDLLALGTGPASAIAVAAPPEPRRADETGPYRIAVVGTGPRGLSVLERLVARLGQQEPGRAVELYAVDAVHVGPGRIWRTSQPHWFLMNTPAGEVTMFSGPPDGGPTRPGNGPSLVQWWQAFDPERAHPHAYAPRAVYGQYLRYVLNQIERALPDGVRLHRVYARAEQLTKHGDGRYLLTFDDQQQVEADRVVLATGHPRPELDPAQLALADFAACHPHLTYVRGDSAADMPLAEIPAGATVGVLGLGLSFYDVLETLTTGRGGRFTEDGAGGLRYSPSGQEPLIVAGSRSGVPLLARGRNQKEAEYRYRPRLFTRKRMLAARRQGRLDFRSDVLPWLQGEVELVYYSTEIRRRFGADVADRFVAEAVAAAGREPADGGGGGPAGAVSRCAARYGVDDLPPVDLAGWSRPFAHRRFGGPAEYHQALADLLRRDLALSEEGNADGPVKACLDTIRDVRGVIRAAVDFDGLTPESHRSDFLGHFVPVTSLLTTGPPRDRLRQVLALLDCGVLRVSGPHTRTGADPERRRFFLESPQVAGSRVLLDAVVDARIPEPDLSRDTGLLARLRDAGMLAGHVNDGPDGSAFATGGIDVTRSPYHPVRADGEPERGLYVLGIPTEYTRWFTQVGSGRPGHWGDFVADADAIAEDALRGLPRRELAAATGEPGTRPAETATAGEPR